MTHDTLRRIAHALYASTVVALCFTVLMLWLGLGILIARATLDKIA